MVDNDPLRFNYIENFSQQDKILGFRKRNILEGAVAAVITGWLLHFIPFVLRVQIIVILSLSGCVFIFFLLGIHNRSVTEWLLLWIRFRQFKKPLHLRSVKYEKYRGIDTTDENGQRYSYAEQGLAFARKYIREAKEADPSNASGLEKAIKRVADAKAGKKQQ